MLTELSGDKIICPQCRSKIKLRIVKTSEMGLTYINDQEKYVYHPTGESDQSYELHCSNLDCVARWFDADSYISHLNFVIDNPDDTQKSALLKDIMEGCR